MAERVYRHLLGLDLEEVPIPDFVTFIEQLTDQRKPFAVLQKNRKTYAEEELFELVRKPKPLIGYGGKNTFPFISDPDQNIKGAFGIVDETLIYAPRAVPLHDMRDAYTWSYSNPQYYCEATVIDIVNAFIMKGYPLLRSNDLLDYRKEYRFTIEGPTSLSEITI